MPIVFHLNEKLYLTSPEKYTYIIGENLYKYKNFGEASMPTTIDDHLKLSAPDLIHFHMRMPRQHLATITFF